jgi:hypothetical protein
MMVEIDSSLLIAKPIPKGYSWTLTSRLGAILGDAECRYGKRVNKWTILGIEFREEGLPQLWYPGDCGNVVVQLTVACLNDLPWACYQMAHESIHLLSPSGGRYGTALEEGLADIYSSVYMKEKFDDASWRSGNARYELASGRVRQFLSSCPDAIRVLRRREPTLSRITADLIKETYPDIELGFAEALTQRFPYEDKA